MEEISRTRNSVRNSFWGIMAKLISMIFPFFFRAIIIRKIGAEYVGLNGLFAAILKVLNMTELGFGSSIVFMMYKPISQNNTTEVRQLMNLMKSIYRVVGLVILVIGCSIFPFLNVLAKNDTGADVNIYILYSMYLSHVVLSYFMFAYRSAIFTATQRSDILSKIALGCELVMYLMQAIVLMTTRNYYLYILVYAVMIIPQNLMYYFLSKRIFPEYYCEGKPTPKQIATLKGKVMPLLGHRIGGVVIVSIDDIIISTFLGITVLTKYDNYYYIFHSIVGLLTVLRNGIMASIGNKLYTDTIEHTYKAYKRIAFLWMGIVGLCAACLAGLYQPFIRIWVGDRYVYDTFMMLSIVAYFYVWQFRFIGVTMKDSAGLWEPDKLKPYIGMTLNLGLSILMVKLTGREFGVLYPTMFVMLFIYFPWETWVLFKRIFHRSCKDYLILVLRCFISTVAAISVSFFMGGLVGEGSIAIFVLRTIVCTMSAGIVYLITSFKSPELNETIAIAKRFVLKMLHKGR